MITKTASAALVTLALAGALAGAAAAGQDQTTLRFDAAAAATEDGRAAMLDDISRAARIACARTGSHIRDAVCEKDFALSAIATIKRSDLRAELRQGYLGAAAPEVTVAEAPGD